jgi:uncharacterized protein (TIGR04255 family)
MATVRHLRNAPITEALIDVRAFPPVGFDPQSLLLAKTRLASRYPFALERMGTEALFELKVGMQPTTTARDLGLQGVFVKSPDEKQIAQFRVDGFTFNRLKPYTSWEAILPEALDLWDVYVDIVNPGGVTRVAVRYINHIVLPPAPQELDDYIVTAPQLPQGVPQVFSAFSTRVVMNNPEANLRANVRQKLEVGIETTNPTLLLDIDAYRSGAFSRDRDSLHAVLTELRMYKNQIFFGSVTDSLVEALA